MKKNIIALFALMVMGQSCSAITKDQVKTAQQNLINMNSFLAKAWNLPPQKAKLNNIDVVQWQDSMKTIAEYAMENSKDILGNTDMSLILAASALLDINQKIIDVVLSIQNSQNIQKSKEDGYDQISELLYTLNDIPPTINRYYKTVSKQYAQKALLDAIENISSIIITLKNRLK